ncbi:MAG TPA: hypothetical protein VME46_21860, partial [Acidimicrobiales bacterium]|nr:hypothetical protein [Acidimicrobiales bacterium]
LVAALVVVAVSLAACGGSPSKGVASVGSTTTTSPGSAAQVPVAGAVRFASCMRSHGVTNYPDPSGSGRPQSLKQINPSSPTFLRAYEACQKYAPLGEGGGPPPPSAAQLRFALAFAHCVRAHGFAQFPDPLTSYPDQAEFTLGQGMYFLINGTYQVQSPAFVHAAKTCGVQLPTGPP